MDKEIFAENIKFLREHKGLKQADMLAAIGFNYKTWNTYERAASYPKYEDLEKISQYFGVTETHLLHIKITDANLIQIYNSFQNVKTEGVFAPTDTPPPHVSGQNLYKKDSTQGHLVPDSVPNLSQKGTFKGKKPVIPYGTEPSIPMYMEDKSAPYGGQCQECLIKDEKIKDQAHIIAALAGQIEALKLATSQMKARLQPQATRNGKK